MVIGRIALFHSCSLLMPVSGIIELLDDDSVRFLVSSDLEFSGIVML